jgi:hypothetical protein
LQRGRAGALPMHEHLFIFRKPVENEDLSRIRYSTWKGVQKAEDAETYEDYLGLTGKKK